MALKTCIDTSVLVALFTVDPATDRAVAALRRPGLSPIISDWAAAELASAVALKVRSGRVDGGHARNAFAEFDAWTFRVADRAALLPLDVAAATVFLRRLDLPLRAPDALHLAICLRLSATLLTFDVAMADSAIALGCPVLPA